MDALELGRHFPNASGISLLGAGGQKLVFAATHATHGPIVIKLIHQNQDLERVKREVDAVEIINSARVPPVLEKGAITDASGRVHVWLIEARIQGQCLRQVLQKGPVPYSLIPTLGHDLLEAIRDAESRRIVHRDIKPDNVMVDQNGRFWLLDFGIARHLDKSSLTATVNAWGLGTPGYAPPEQYKNQKDLIHTCTDLFALGTTIYEAVTGVNPYLQGAGSVAEVLRRIEFKDVVFDPSQFHGNTKLIGFLSTTMNARRSHRPSSARDALGWWLDIFPEVAT
ncbi:MAG: serine/threonine protein kinase [Holophagaceae bacterium]|nr:serine/threonine protein kinase [Holophagaceae bacterium]